MITDEQAKAAIDEIRKALLVKGGMLAVAGRQLTNPTPEVIEVVKSAIEKAMQV